LKLNFQDQTSDTADLLIGADGINSVVMQQLLAMPSNQRNSKDHITSLSSSNATTNNGNSDDKDNKAFESSVLEQRTTSTTETRHPESCNTTKNSTTCEDTSYLGIMIVLGITENFYHPLLDERGFYTVDGVHRLFTMPYQGCKLTDLELHNIPLNDQTTTCKRSRRYMWQLSYKLTSIQEAKSLSQSGSQCLVNEVLKRTKSWHEPIQDMILATPLESVWGTPLMDRQPFSLYNQIKKTYSPHQYTEKEKIVRTLRTVVSGDSIHAMSPFKGQGCNQALMDGPLLTSKLERSNIDVAIWSYMREMIQRTDKKVIDSRKAANYLHSAQVLIDKDDFAGVRKDSTPLLLRTLEERGIGAHLGKELDNQVAAVIDELNVHQLSKTSNEENNENYAILQSQQKHALKLAASGDLAAIRFLSMSHPDAIRTARDEATKESCLHKAARFGCYHTFKWFLSEACLSYDDFNVDGHTVMGSAIIGGNLRIISVLAKLTKP